MGKTKFGIILLLASVMAASAPTMGKAKLSKEELEKMKGVNFKFNNKNEKLAPVSMIKSQILEGQGAAKEMGAADSGVVKAGYYTVNRVFDSTSPKFGADIVSLSKTFKGGHSDVIKRFLIGYVEVNFDYGRQDARILSTFILHYNGINRQKINKLKEIYSPSVIAALDPTKVGIEKKWYQWPGKTQLVIPLAKNILKPTQKDINIEILYEDTKPVLVEKVEKTGDKKTEDEIEKFEQFIESKKEEEIEKVAVEIEKVEEKIEENEDYLVSENLSEEDKSKLEEENKELEEKKEELEEKQEELGGPKDKPAELDKGVIEGNIYVMKNINKITNGHYNNIMYKINPVKDNAVLKSKYDKICNNEFVEFGEGIVVIGSLKGGEKDAHYLVKLDLDNLAIMQTSKEKVYWRSALIVKGKGSALFVIERIKGKYYLSRFNKNLKRVTVSSINISKDSHITFYKNKIYVTGALGKDSNKMNIYVLNRADLKLLKSIKGK